MTDNQRYLHPLESGEQLSRMSSGVLHRHLTDYRAVHAIFSRIVGHAHTRVKAIQSILTKRAHDTNGLTIPEPAGLSRPQTGGGMSEHGLLRYLERVRGIDLAAVEAEAMERLADAEVTLGGAVLIDRDGFAYIVNEAGLVKSVMPNSWMDNADRVVAEETYRIKRRRAREDHLPALAAK